MQPSQNVNIIETNSFQKILWYQSIAMQIWFIFFFSYASLIHTSIYRCGALRCRQLQKSCITHTKIEIKRLHNRLRNTSLLFAICYLLFNTMYSAVHGCISLLMALTNIADVTFLLLYYYYYLFCVYIFHLSCISTAEHVLDYKFLSWPLIDYGVYFESKSRIRRKPIQTHPIIVR